MSETTSGKKMNEYTPLANEDKEYLFGDGSGSVVTVGRVNSSGNIVNRLVKLSEIAKEETGSVTDVTVNGESVVEDGVAHIPEIPNPANLAGVGLEFDGSALNVSNPMPSSSGYNSGDVLTINNDLQPSWQAPVVGGGMRYVYVANPRIIEGDIPLEVQNNTFTELVVPGGGVFETIGILVPDENDGTVRDLYISITSNQDIGQMRPVSVFDSKSVELKPMFMSTSPTHQWLTKNGNMLIHVVHNYYTVMTSDKESS
jgi:hypothetical protein